MPGMILLGRNPSVGTGAFETVWFNGGAYPFQTAAAKVRVKAGGDAADTVAGAGARRIRIEGLDANWNEISEVLDTNGILASADTVASFLRINKVTVTESGTYGAANTANIVIETNPGAVVLANIEAGLGVSQLGFYSVPANKTIFIPHIGGYYDTAKTGNVRLMIRKGADIIAAPFTPPIKRFSWDGVAGGFQDDMRHPIVLPPKTDMYFEAIAITTAGAVEVHCDMFENRNYVG